MNNVFVYGTLKRNGRNHHLLNDSRLLTARATTCDKYIMLDLGFFPAVIDEPGVSVIHGEIYTVSAATLADLDLLEGHPTFYRRKIIATNVGDAWLYFLHCPVTRARDAVILPAGNW